MLAVTPLIGNNSDENVFELEHVRKLVQKAKGEEFGQLSFWPISRDNGHYPGRGFSSNCSGIDQEGYGFTKIFIGDFNQILSTPLKSKTIGLSTKEMTTLGSITPIIRITEPYITNSSSALF